MYFVKVPDGSVLKSIGPSLGATHNNTNNDDDNNDDNNNDDDNNSNSNNSSNTSSNDSSNNSSNNSNNSRTNNISNNHHTSNTHSIIISISSVFYLLSSLWHTRNQHLGDRRGFSAVFSNGFSGGIFQPNVSVLKSTGPSPVRETGSVWLMCCLVVCLCLFFTS